MILRVLPQMSIFKLDLSGQQDYPHEGKLVILSFRVEVTTNHTELSFCCLFNEAHTCDRHLSSNIQMRKNTGHHLTRTSSGLLFSGL